MGFKAVFRSLQEVFPQVDLRILKAVAIEHSKDADEAVEFILSDVLPLIIGPPGASHTLHDTQETKYSSMDAELNNLGFLLSHSGEEANASLLSGPTSVAYEITPLADHTSAALPIKSLYIEKAAGGGAQFECAAQLNNLSPRNELVEVAIASLPGEPLVAPHNALTVDSLSEPFHVKAPDLDDPFADNLHLPVLCGKDIVQSRVSDEEATTSLGKHQVRSWQGSSAPPSFAELNNLGFLLSHGGEEASASLLSGPTSVAYEITPLADHTSAALPIKSLYIEKAAGGGAQFECAAQLNNLSSRNEFVIEAIESLPEEPLVAPHNALAVDSISEPFHVKAPHLDDPFADDLHLPVLCGKDIVQSRVGDEEATTSLEKHQVRSWQGSSSPPSFGELEDTNFVCAGTLHAIQHFPQLVANDTVPAVCTTFQHFTPPAPEKNTDSMEHGTTVEQSSYSTGCEHDGQSRCLVENGNDQIVFDAEVVAIDNKYHPATITTRSGQVVSIDLLENFVTDAKNNKKALVSAMESVVILMKEVELYEKEANEAKDEASKAGLDILAKVEDLKQMLKHAMEANDMHAGEVYGEKSILATEARELQSRLLFLSDERDRALSIIEEMHQTLKARLAAAEAERVAAEQEKLEKEKMAHEALFEQELIMDKVLQESMKLQQEAEENSKLREFLMDRGHIVDVLQGEIAVICEDVVSLKERVDGHVPLSKSLSSSHTNCTLASSSSSQKSTLSDRIPTPVELSENPNKEYPKSQQLDGHTKSIGISVVAGVHKVSSEDDWELFEDDRELYN